MKLLKKHLLYSCLFASMALSTGCSSTKEFFSVEDQKTVQVVVDYSNYPHSGASCLNIKMTCDQQYYRNVFDEKGRLLCGCDEKE